jgi:DNA-3-methyladenine glycosylase II
MVAMQAQWPSALWESACAHLVSRDRVLKNLIPRLGPRRLESRGDAFNTLARSVVGQQISVKAAQSVWLRLLEAFGACGQTGLLPAQLLDADPVVMKSAGLSPRKIEYLKDLALRFSDGSLRLQSWPEMTDEAIIEDLVSVRGIGRWTAEMFLIFHMMRPDVLPLDDAGLMKGISTCYFSGESVSRAEARELGDGWAPFRSVATWFMWRSLEIESSVHQN